MNVLLVGVQRPVLSSVLFIITVNDVKKTFSIKFTGETQIKGGRQTKIPKKFPSTMFE